MYEYCPGHLQIDIGEAKISTSTKSLPINCTLSHETMSYLHGKPSMTEKCENSWQVFRFMSLMLASLM